MNHRFVHCIVSALLCFGCATGGQTLVVGAVDVAQITARDSDELLTVAEALARVESLRAKKTMSGYQQALDLLAQIVRIDESQQSLASAVQGEFDDYLWAVHSKFERGGEDLQRDFDAHRAVPDGIPSSRPSP